MDIKKTVAGALALVLFVAAAYFIWKHFVIGKPDDSILRLSGNIEVTEAHLSFKIAGHLKNRLADEGDAAQGGQLLAQLDDDDQRLAAQTAEANLALAKAALAELEAGNRAQEIAVAEAALIQAKAINKTARAQLEQAASDHARYKALVKNGGVSRQQFETQATLFNTARHQAEEAEAGIKVAAEKLDLLKAGARAETIDQAKARLAAAQTALAQARQQLTYTKLNAPFTGVVLTTAAEDGEFLQPGSTVLTLARLNRPWLRAYIPENKLARVRLGQTATVTADSLPGKSYPGTISFIANESEFTPKSVQTFEERVKLVYRLKIDLDNPQGELKAGMPADAIIELSVGK
ncbi:MAG: efflux RND transporter periplasmic adaptor subunit [Desulfobulbaceae bacterium]|jgi:HlyD family secretion protein|nr:efflux RND transporter periplasmic adaptor subunit [Desulfobulbaceae bacterium]